MLGLLFFIFCLSFVNSASVRKFPCSETEPVPRDQCSCPIKINSEQPEPIWLNGSKVVCNHTSLECSWKYNDSSKSAYISIYGWSHKYNSFTPSSGCCGVKLEEKVCRLDICAKILAFSVSIEGNHPFVSRDVVGFGKCFEKPDFVPYDFDTEDNSGPTQFHFYAILICLFSSLVLAFASVFCYFQLKRRKIEKSTRNNEFRRSRKDKKPKAAIPSSEKSSETTRSSVLQDW